MKLLSPVAVVLLLNAHMPSCLAFISPVTLSTVKRQIHHDPSCSSTKKQQPLLPLYSSTTSSSSNIGYFSDSELETAFFSIDIESRGSIPRSKFSEALADLGVNLDTIQADSLFKKYDADKGGSIDLEEFKKMMSDPVLVGLKPQRDVKFAMDLFRRYDTDKSGSIDKAEFRTIAREIQIDARRRSLFSITGAAIGATIVSDYSDEYLWVQKNFRNLYVEEQAEKAQKLNFPTALLSSDMDEAIARTLYRRGFTPKNTIFAHSVCSDEVNNKDEQLVALMIKRWQEGFSLGGLAGVPFAGRSGFGAYLHHVPDSGKLLIMFGPHVGIDASGKIGALQRDGQSSVSNACGAAVGAYNALKKSNSVSTTSTSTGTGTNGSEDPEYFDPQLETILKLLRPRLAGIEKSIDPITFVTYQIYAIIRDKLCECVSQTPDVWDYTTEVALCGGIMINRRSGGDFFQPLSFETRIRDGNAKGMRIDLFEEAFGERPDLIKILGSKEAVACLYNEKKS